MSVFTAGSDAQALVTKHSLTTAELKAAATEVNKRRAKIGLGSVLTFVAASGVAVMVGAAPITSIPLMLTLGSTFVPAVGESVCIKLTDFNHYFNRLHRDKAVVLEAVRRHVPDAQPAPQALTAA